MDAVSALDFTLWEQEFEPLAELRCLAMLHEMDNREDALYDQDQEEWER